jgi:hypothetical protein
MVFQEGRAIRPPFYHADYRNPIARPQPDRQFPEIETVSPDSVLEGDEAITLTITGKNFLSTDVVRLNGKPIPSEVKFRPARFPQNFRRTREMTATLPAGLVRAPGLYSIVVEHPGMGGIQSNAAPLVVKFK